VEAKVFGMTLLSTTSKATPGGKGADASKHQGIIIKGGKAAVGVKAAQGAAKHPGIITKGAKAAVGVKAAQGVAKHPGIIAKGAKAALAVLGVEAAAKHPRVVRVGLKSGKPVARRKVRKGIDRVERFGDSAREVGEALLIGSELVAQGLGLVERPKARPAGPLLAGGAVIGAGAVYFFDRRRGPKHRSALPKAA